MSILVRIPTPLRRLTGGQGEITAEGATVGELLDRLEQRFPGIKERLYDEAGQLRRFVNIYINDEDIRFAQGTETILKTGDEVSIVPAIAGGKGPTITNKRPSGKQGGLGRGGIGGSALTAGGPHGSPHQMEPPWQA